MAAREREKTVRRMMMVRGEGATGGELNRKHAYRARTTSDERKMK